MLFSGFSEASSDGVGEEDRFAYSSFSSSSRDGNICFCKQTALGSYEREHNMEVISPITSEYGCITTSMNGIVHSSKLPTML